MTRIRPLSLAFAAAVALGLASLAHAQKDTTHPYTGAVTGAVTASDAAAHTITVKGPNDDGGVYTTNADTQVVNGGKTVKVADLKKGWRVVVSWDYASVDSQKKVAKRIEVVDMP